MLHRKSLIALGLASALGLCLATSATAKISAEEADRLGKDLTPIGAEMAGNADGTIPPYEGGYLPGDSGFSKAGKFYADPFTEDKVLFSITAANVEEYKDKLNEGQIAMLKKYPETYRIDVYKTRRTIAYPEWYNKNTKDNATRAELTPDGLGIIDSFGGIPFPIPSNGNEVMTNKGSRYGGSQYVSRGLASGIVYPNGKYISAGGASLEVITPFNNKDGNLEWFQTENNYLTQAQFYIFDDPPRRKGEILLVRVPQNLSTDSIRAWSYLPGQRRVRRAPNVSHDNPNPSTGGHHFYDESNLFGGELDRFDWKLVGKREMYVPYNNYAMNNPNYSEFLTPYHINPDHMRWELHRVWVVEATVKEGKRHAFQKRVIYLDEDSWEAMATDNYDSQGELWRTRLLTSHSSSDIPAFTSRVKIFYDLQKTDYGVDAVRMGEDASVTVSDEITLDQGYFTPEEVRRQGRR